MCHQLNFYEDVKVINWGRIVFLTNRAGIMNSHPIWGGEWNSIHKSHHTEINWKRIIAKNVRVKTKKPLDVNIGERLCNFEVGKDILSRFSTRLSYKSFYVLQIYSLSPRLPFQFLNSAFQVAKILQIRVMQFIILYGFLVSVCVCSECLYQFWVKPRIS